MEETNRMIIRRDAKQAWRLLCPFSCQMVIATKSPSDGEASMVANPRALIVLALSIVPLLSAPVLAQKISYDYRAHEPSGSFKTFAFKETEPPDTLSHKTTTY